MEKEFVTYEQSIELKKLLYGEHYGDDYFAWYSSNKHFHYRNMNSPVYPNNQSFIAPLKQQVFRWFREKYGWIGGIRQLSSSGSSMIVGEFRKDDDNNFILFRDTYEEVENACIDELIEIAKIQTEIKPCE